MTSSYLVRRDIFGSIPLLAWKYSPYSTSQVGRSPIILPLNLVCLQKWVILRMSPTSLPGYLCSKKHEEARTSRTLLESFDHMAYESKRQYHQKE